MIFFFDVDGTLLYHKEWRVPASAVQALKELHDRGHLLYLNTSRSPNEMVNVAAAMRELPLDGAVLTGGALVLAGEGYAPLYGRTLGGNPRRAGVAVRLCAGGGALAGRKADAPGAVCAG